MKKVLIIGGGFAGLSASVALAREGLSVLLLEQRRLLGGRAYSVPDGATGEWVDNGQHALLGGFHETRRFLELLGTESRVRFQRRFEIVLAEPGGKKIRLTALPLPAPLHVGAGLLSSAGLSFRERFHLVRAGLSILRTKRLPETMTVAEWLDAMAQPDSLRRRWWHPLSVAAMNERPERASAGLFLNVIRRAFFGRARDSSFGIMTVSLGELYTEQSRNFIESNGGRVLLNSPAARIHFSKTRVESVELRDGSRVGADHYISAVPHPALTELLPDSLARTDGPFSGLRSLSSSPILSVHLWFDRPVMEEEFIGLVDSPIHWVFDKTRLWRNDRARAGAVSCVVSGAHDLIDRPPGDLIELARRELIRYLPEADGAGLTHARVIKERMATYSCTPEAERARPEQRTAYSNFYLAGDWTRTGLPATIESAVLSGRRCAEMILRAGRH